MIARVDAERLWSRIKEVNGCWISSYAKNRDGYSHMKIGGRTVGTHRVAWMVRFGPIPDGMCVCHRCDNRACCNPAHLFLGTHQENIQDMVLKGRQPNRKGEKCGHAKVTEKDVRVIRDLSLSHVETARLFGISPVTISQIRSGRKWPHVTMDKATTTTYSITKNYWNRRLGK